MFEKDSQSLSAQVKKQALDLVKKGNMHQNLRKEIMFGLLPTTAIGKWFRIRKTSSIFKILRICFESFQ